MKKLVFTLFILFFIIKTNYSQQTVTFSADDGVIVTADHYVTSTKNPYLILLHQAGYSRGEYRETAPKFANLGYNCLAVDLRSGNEVNFIKNKTAQNAKENGYSTSYIDALKDIEAAIGYVANRSNQPIILVGSSYSASLALIEATENFKVKAVVAFSPGEYFGDHLIVKDATKKLYVPVLVLTTKLEYPDAEKMLYHLNKKHLSLFKPTVGEGVHGSRALWEKNPNSNEYWMAISQFFSNLDLN